MPVPDTCNILWKALLRKGEIITAEVPDSFELTEEKQKFRDNLWTEKSKRPGAFDGKRLRYEGVNFSNLEGPVELEVSRSVPYGYHDALRGISGHDLRWYPNPASTNALPKTTDDMLILAIKGGISDQRGLGAVGGFLEDYEGKPLEDIFDSCANVINREAEFKSKVPYDIEEMTALGAVFGSNRDTTIPIIVPLNVSSNGIKLKKIEADKTIFLEIRQLEKFAENPLKYCKEKFDAVPVDHLVGGVYLLSKNAKKLRY